MKVFFSASTSKLPDYFDVYKTICDAVVSAGHELTRDWLDEALEVVTHKLSVDYEEMYEDIMASILYADVGVVDGSVKGLSTGHQMTVALQKGKPILFLHQKSKANSLALHTKGIHSELLTDKSYEKPEEIPGIVEEFLSLHKKGKRVRFNLVLTPKEQQYIEWASFTYDKTKTDVIRELIETRIDSDINYKRKHKKLR